MPEWLTELEMLARRLSASGPLSMRCAECDAVDDGRRGWTLRLDVDDELVAFCPDCDAREFGDGC